MSSPSSPHTDGFCPQCILYLIYISVAEREKDERGPFWPVPRPGSLEIKRRVGGEGLKFHLLLHNPAKWAVKVLDENY
jgi:hypothetical protein